MDKTLFFILGPLLVVSAVAVALTGLRRPDFPSSRGVLAGVIAYFAVLVAATATFAVLNAADEQHTRQAEAAATTTTTQETTTNAQGATGTTTAEQPTQGKATTVDISADPTALAFDQQKLSTKSGQVTVDFDNPSQVGHDVCVKSSSGDELGCTQVITQSKTTLDANLEPGTYTFYCSVDGHEAAGMEGSLTVK
jgi:plastocyanin